MFSLGKPPGVFLPNTPAAPQDNHHSAFDDRNFFAFIYSFYPYVCTPKLYNLALPVWGVYIIGINLHVSSIVLLVAIIAFPFHCCIVCHCVNAHSETGSYRESRYHWS